MKNFMVTVVLSVMSLSAFAGETALKMESFECGLQVGKSIAKLKGTGAEQDAVVISEDIVNYSAQIKLSMTLKKKSEKQQVEQAANNSWQSITYALGQIKAVSAEEAQAISTACDL